MPRALWKGSISFGLVNIPIELHTAVRNHRPHFRMLHATDKSPVKFERVCIRDGHPVAWEDLVKGYEYQKGRFVVVTRDDFEAAALEKTRTIDIIDFVKADEIDDRYFETPYYLVPAKGGERAYALLRDAVRESGRIGIAKFILRDAQHLAAVEVIEQALVLTVMRFADELVDEEQFNLPRDAGMRKPEREMAKALVNSLAAAWDPSKYTDQYRDNLMRVIKSKIKGKAVRLEPPAEPRDTEVVDLMERLRRSLSQSGSRPRARKTRRRAGAPRPRRSAGPKRRERLTAEILRPMLASLTEAPLDDPHFVYEPKYDGIRAIAEVDAAGGVRLWSRLGNDKTHQFPEIAEALGAWARRRKTPRSGLVLDGEVVALDAKGQPSGFQQLQGRIHLASGSGGSTAFIVFDILRDGRTDLRGRPLLERRAVLERVFSSAVTTAGSRILRLSEVTQRDGRALYTRALKVGWEGLIAKPADSPYQSGKRTPDWRKLKIVHEQEFVVAGWTEPRHTRSYFGALLLGVYEHDHRRARGERRESKLPASSAASAVPSLVYVGHTGTGFNERELSRVMKLLKPLETTASPFHERPRTNERAHWVKPLLVAQIKFTEWTSDGKLRHPVYLGLRDDKKATDIVREREVRVREESSGGFKVQGSAFRVRFRKFRVRFKVP